ncbi:4Fe-4S binding protein [bacterium]|nr:4Fe-4S binding protein [bacterium]
MDIEKSIREEAKKLLDEGKVDVLIGYKKGTLPLRSSPAFIRNSEDVDSLIFDPACSNNLALYIKRFEGKVGVIAKGCDGRSLTTLVVDRQIDKDRLFVVGVPCSGVVDRRKIYAKLDACPRLRSGRGEIADCQFSDGRVIVRGRDWQESLDLSAVLSDSCLICRHKTPPVYDLLIGEEIKEEGKPVEELEAFKKKSPDERWRFFEEELSKCIRCYACRQVCPVCLCEYCIVDRTMPLWFGKTTDLSDTIMFHLIRAYHTAGRCVDCGACVRACPVGVDFRLLNKRLEDEVKERFGFTAGVKLGEPAPLSAYKEEDKEEFIM